jgi:hypothetical protein
MAAGNEKNDEYQANLANNDNINKIVDLDAVGGDFYYKEIKEHLKIKPDKQKEFINVYKKMGNISQWIQFQEDIEKEENLAEYKKRILFLVKVNESCHSCVIEMFSINICFRIVLNNENLYKCFKRLAKMLSPKAEFILKQMDKQQCVNTRNLTLFQDTAEICRQIILSSNKHNKDIQ